MQQFPFIQMAMQEYEIEGQSYGITNLMLLSYELKLSTSKQFCRLPGIEVITNELIIELKKFKDSHQCTSKMLSSWIKDLFGKHWPQESPPTTQAIVNSTDRLMTKYKRLQKQHSSSKKQEVIFSFLQEEYIIPQSRNTVSQSSVCVSSKSMRTELQAQRDKIQQLQCKAYSVSRNAKKRQSRRDAIIEQQTADIKYKQKVIQEYEMKVESLDKKFSAVKAKLSRVNHRVAYWRAKAADIKGKDTAKKANYSQKIGELKEDLFSAHMLNAQLREDLDAELNSEICTFEDGKYTDDVRACVYELLSLNVGIRNITPVILCVLKNMVHKSATRLPKHATTCNMILEALIIVQAQLGEELSSAESALTLQTDGTTKYGKHYTTYDVCSDVGVSYTLGIRHVFSGSALNTLETLKGILEDLDKVQLALGKDAVSSKIVSNLKNTISDRHAAEKLFNELLCDFRADILPSVVKNWDELSQEEKSNFMHMNNFFCGLHFIVGLADTAEESVRLWESSENSNSGTQRLIRTACKAFHHQGSQQCGSFTLFKEYLKSHQIEKIPLARFVGNRFNILFYDAAGVYYLHSYMISYIESVHGNQANRLLQSVLADLKSPVFEAGCRALGLVDKIITGPLWRKLTESSVSVLQMSNVYCEMKDKFDQWKEDAVAFTKGEAFLDSAGEVHKDEVWLALINPCDSDAMTTELLQVLFGAFSITTQRMLLDHLPGGQYHSVTDQRIIEETTSIPTTNVQPERDFAIFDRLLREKPNATSIALESVILFSQNKTSKWLDQKTATRREKIIQAARSIAPATRQTFRERKKEMERKQAQTLAKRQQETARLHHKKQQEKERLTKEVAAIGGLWTCEDEVSKGLDALDKKTAKVKALKLQLNFRQKVLYQTCSDKSLFKFSQKGKQHTVEQLASNLLKLLGDGHTTSEYSKIEEILSYPHLLVGKRIKQRFNVGGELIWYDGTVLGRLEGNEYEVMYDEDDDIYRFSLLDDIENGDLEII